MKRGSSRIAPVVVALAVLLLVGIVAVAATGSTSVGTSDGRPPAEILFDTILSLGLLALLPAAALLVYGLLQRKQVAREYARLRHLRSGVASIVVLAAFLAVYAHRARPFSPQDDGVTDKVFPGGPATPNLPPTGSETPYEPRFAWLPVLVVLGIAAVATCAWYLSGRHHGALEPDDEELADDVADALEDSLDDLRAEPDARRAVIAAYARLEEALAEAGLPRRRPETAEEFVARILDRLEVGALQVRTLTDLFTTAKFSHHGVDAAMKEAAIAALERIRDELREAARCKRQQQAEASTAHEEAVAS